MRMFRGLTAKSCWVAVVFALACAASALNSGAQDVSKLSGDVSARVDRIAQRVLAETGAPSASVAIVRDNEVVYVRAYGDARLDPRAAARPEMRYSVGSISKQFTATALLMLSEEGRLTLDDSVSKFLPDLTRANEVSIRQLLSHTSGYQDYWPQDYVMPFMLKEVTAQEILDRWARKPLDFEPGTRWQYSNTNYVIAGLIIEKITGQPLLRYLRSHVFGPLGMQSVVNVDQDRLTESDPVGYMRYALGPPRVAPKEGKGWLFAAGELAMTAEDLAKWDIGMLKQLMLKSANYHEMQTAVKLKNGEATHYGLGVGVGRRAGHPVVEHGGEVSGFSAQNIVFPEDSAAIVVLVNQDSTSAAGEIAGRIAPLLFPGSDVAAQKVAQARKIFEGLQHGKIDRSLFSENCNAYFDEQAIQDFAASLGPLGTPEDFALQNEASRGGMAFRSYQASFPHQRVVITTYTLPDGKIEQFQVAPAN
jgi:D-alanyl-D-alanine carboxypeptidase